jgi:hypothetical protein
MTDAKLTVFPQVRFLESVSGPPRPRYVMIKILLAALAASFLLTACGQDASKKGPAPATTPPPAEKKTEAPKK